MQTVAQGGPVVPGEGGRKRRLVETPTVAFRCPEDLHRTLRIFVAAERSTLAQVCIAALREYFQARAA